LTIWGKLVSDFIGRFLNKVDQKGRVSVPAIWRPRLTKENFSGIIAQSGMSEKAIDAYPKDYLDIIQNKIDQNDPLSEETEYETTVLFGGSMLAFDREGRVNLPESYKKDADIKKEALFVGMGRRFRIWDPNVFEDYLIKAKLHMKDRRKK